jgi:nitrogen fixation protein NifU and related proteins
VSAQFVVIVRGRTMSIRFLSHVANPRSNGQEILFAMNSVICDNDERTSPKGRPPMRPYSATLLDHVLAPRNAGEIETPDVIGTASLGGRAPYVRIYLQVDAGVIERVTFQTFGCGVSIACCSALTEMAGGKAVADARSISAADLLEALTGIPQEKQFCAAMAIDALRDALDQLSCKSTSS